jgi:hypothetical protein
VTVFGAVCIPLRVGGGHVHTTKMQLCSLICIYINFGSYFFLLLFVLLLMFFEIILFNSIPSFFFQFSHHSFDYLFFVFYPFLDFF